MNPVFTYNEDQAIKAGQSQFISETGAYLCTITAARWLTAQSGAEALELTIETDDGQKGDYLAVYYQNRNGESLPSGQNMIQAIMGCTGTKQLTRVPGKDSDIAPELTGKKIGLFLQKELYTKTNGNEGYRFHIVCPFGTQTRKTLIEHKENRPAERIDWLIANVKDKDSRETNHQQTMQNQTALYGNQNAYANAKNGSYTPPPADNFDDGIPF